MWGAAGNPVVPGRTASKAAPAKAGASGFRLDRWSGSVCTVKCKQGSDADSVTRAVVVDGAPAQARAGSKFCTARRAGIVVCSASARS